MWVTASCCACSSSSRFAAAACSWLSSAPRRSCTSALTPASWACAASVRRACSSLKLCASAFRSVRTPCSCDSSSWIRASAAAVTAGSGSGAYCGSGSGSGAGSSSYCRSSGAGSGSGGATSARGSGASSTASSGCGTGGAGSEAGSGAGAGASAAAEPARRRPEPSGAAGGVCGGAATGAGAGVGSVDCDAAASVRTGARAAISRRPALVPYSVRSRPPCCSARALATAPGETKPRSTSTFPSGVPLRFCSARASRSWSSVRKPSSTMIWPSCLRVSGAASTTTSIGRKRETLKGLRTLARQRPQNEGEPVDADHVRLDPEHEHGDERAPRATAPVEARSRRARRSRR